MSRAASKGNAAVVKLRQALGGVGEVRDPSDAEEPILAYPVRKAIAGWLVELNNAEELASVGIKPRSTALLFGPPGCGKTTLAHHLSARLGIPLILIGSENVFQSSLGGSEQAVARIFDALAAADTPCVVFLDEIDAIGSKRSPEGSGGGGARTAMNSTLNVLLRRIEEYRGVMIGATNFADGLDPALWRRFGMQIDVALPGGDERYAILRRYAAPFDFGDDAFEILTDLTDGAAPSLLRQIMEGVKRLLIVGAKIGVPTDSPIDTFRAVIAQNMPHPDYTPPALWADPKSISHLASIPWPPVRGDAE
ncbi:MAG: ATP-binding protein [Methylocella sp.]